VDVNFFLSIIGLAILAIVAFVIARFLLRLTARVVGCVVTIIVAFGILAIVLIFFF
jgi:hypothetical protein